MVVLESKTRKETQMQEKSNSVKKITLSLDEQTLDLLEKYKDKNFLNSKSQAIRVLVNKDAEQTRDD